MTAQTLARLTQLLGEMADTELRPHGSNLLTKATSSPSAKQAKALEEIIPRYLLFAKKGERPITDFDHWLILYTKALETYLSYLRSGPSSLFSHQSDFQSSVVPEYICRILHRLASIQKVPIEVKAQSDLEIELMFTALGQKGTLHARLKRVDAAAVLPSRLVFQDEERSFLIPAIAIEVKTNLDKNMITGVENAVSDLKSTFPLCKYFVISEFCDFQVEKQSYANSGIDELYILRQQKRSEFRSTKSAKPISIGVVREFCAVASDSLRSVGAELPDVSTRLGTGRLVHWEQKHVC